VSLSEERIVWLADKPHISVSSGVSVDRINKQRLKLIGLIDSILIELID